MPLTFYQAGAGIPCLPETNNFILLTLLFVRFGNAGNVAGCIGNSFARVSTPTWT